MRCPFSGGWKNDWGYLGDATPMLCYVESSSALSASLERLDSSHDEAAEDEV